MIRKGWARCAAVAILSASSTPLVLAQEVVEPAPEPASGSAGFDLPADITITTKAGYHSDTDYSDLFGRLNGSAVRGPWQLALRLDSATLVSAPAPDIRDRYSLEKASLRWSNRSVDVTAGDSYVSFGRGLGLSLRKLDEFGVDTTLRGAKVLIHSGPFEGTLTAGFANTNNIDEATGTSIDDPYDLIAGGQGQVRLAGVNLGAYAAAIAFHDQLGFVPMDRYSDRSSQYGVTVEAPQAAPNIGVYFEGMAQRVTSGASPDEDFGFALYGTATGYFGKSTLILEGKAYGDLMPVIPNLGEPAFAAVAYNSPPTLERTRQELENPARRIVGGRSRVDYALSHALLAYINYGLFTDYQGYADPDSGAIRAGMIHDPYAGTELRWDEGRSWATLQGGWRIVVLDETSDIVRRDGHMEFDLAQRISDFMSFSFQGFHQERRKHESSILDKRFREGTIGAGVRLRTGISVFGGYDYTTEAAQPKTHYFNGNLGWDINTSSSLGLFVGAARGGLRCVSGLCRVLPPFEGVRLTATVRI